MTRTPPDDRRRLTGGATGAAGGDLKAGAKKGGKTPREVCSLPTCLVHHACRRCALVMGAKRPPPGSQRRVEILRREGCNPPGETTHLCGKVMKPNSAIQGAVAWRLPSRSLSRGLLSRQALGGTRLRVSETTRNAPLQRSARKGDTHRSQSHQGQRTRPPLRCPALPLRWIRRGKKI